MKTILALTFSLLSLTSYANECSDVFTEVVNAEKACLAKEKSLNKEIDYGYKLYDQMVALPYKNQYEIDVMNNLKKKLDRLQKEGRAELNAVCDKRWDSSAVFLGMCSKGTLACVKNKSNKFDLKISSEDKRSHVLHTYPTQYECIIRKKKIETASKQ